jgi:hypothetical protein
LCLAELGLGHYDAAIDEGHKAIERSTPAIGFSWFAGGMSHYSRA